MDTEKFIHILVHNLTIADDFYDFREGVLQDISLTIFMEKRKKVRYKK